MPEIRRFLRSAAMPRQVGYGPSKREKQPIRPELDVSHRRLLATGHKSKSCEFALHFRNGADSQDRMEPLQQDSIRS
jgi:hypothetical protein